jgi:hypothetical protein
MFFAFTLELVSLHKRIFLQWVSPFGLDNPRIVDLHLKLQPFAIDP